GGISWRVCQLRSDLVSREAATETASAHRAWHDHRERIAAGGELLRRLDSAWLCADGPARGDSRPARPCGAGGRESAYAGSLQLFISTVVLVSWYYPSR